MKKSHLAQALLLAVLSGSLAAQTLVTVNGSKISSREVDRYVQALRAQNPNIPADSAEIRSELLSDIVTRTLVVQEARRLKLDQGQEYKAALENARKAAQKAGADKKPGFKQQWEDYQNELLNQAFIAHIARTQPVSDADARKNYEEMQSHYKGSSEVQIGEILTPKKEDAEKAIKDLKANKPFAATARKYSADPQAKQTGGINKEYDPLKDLEAAAPPVYNAVKDLKKGQFTATPIEGNGVYGVFYINDKRPVQIPTFEQVKADITRSLLRQKISKAISDIAEKATITPAGK
ncbi:Putative peptidyl-prolyl cis-trans isomerase Cbf2 precursor [Kingella potus]|uniref:peptidylprolyl isomerase n=1 Tax=Kingella potus TaxID=265175 RepID=A0A377R501_9NEIS|nr:peptidyl-prolyl cis-trans isomerase [Kingella potus]UOP00315.1 peptidyl-prolyl cis-trans isomerase [Kingella potus]STR02625.1 Putative peptidyl-prolyl cis-trans isomerase Cbf2 precursor [Kingella potus]